MKDYDGSDYSDVVPVEGAVGVPDAFQRMWVPYRIAYIESAHNGTSRDGECPFCVAPTLADEESLIVARGTHSYVLLNLFPYNSGHMLVCPYRHVSLYDDATAEEAVEIAELTQIAMRVAREASGAQGFNIGMNQGSIAGAGVADHLHQHVVPRWANDTNFFPIIGGVKAIPRLLGEVREAFASAWPSAPCAE
ncbi:HIT domain-containing protein [Glaciihabitans arcticus]|uniref:HIT domain-containing protein n=1 Tax=Glaciihabitans arcticus TaxID=2668039 RepID=A0A4Q9GPM1_9MICO|nr:HIT domain-containing protein [Glaciihabitans arcticus]TBN56792.1 HIT domain-containing protein [Glaciihabitans arcticus]